MAIFLSDIYNETKKKYELRLIAGKDGLNRELNWVYVAEDQTNSSFLRANELIISTGALYDHTEKWLIHFIQTLIEKQTCGLILNIGKHISQNEITSGVISLCEQHQFPLFVMPWHIHIYDITRDYYNRIFLEMQSENCIDFYQILENVSNSSILDRFVEKKLAPVLEYDKKHNSNFAETLFLYLKYWGSIQDIAEQSYCHRNTITNRLRILQEQLGINLKDPSERFELMAAYMIRNFNKLQKKT
ncbi:MAG: PucR family transcriptional regulator [Muricoprocola sp.]